MYASITVAPIKPDKWDDFASIFSDFINPHVGGPEGLKAAYLLRVPGTDEGMMVVFYGTEAQTKASADPSGLFAEIIPKIAHCFAGQTERKISEVLVAAQ